MKTGTVKSSAVIASVFGKEQLRLRFGDQRAPSAEAGVVLRVH